MSCAGRGLTAESQRRTGYRKQSDKSASRKDRRGVGRQKTERMAFEAKDFHDQAQWALVAIPAPIYFPENGETSLRYARFFYNYLQSVMHVTRQNRILLPIGACDPVGMDLPMPTSCRGRGTHHPASRPFRKTLRKDAKPRISAASHGRCAPRAVSMRGGGIQTSSCKGFQPRRRKDAPTSGLSHLKNGFRA